MRILYKPFSHKCLTPRVAVLKPLLGLLLTIAGCHPNQPTPHSAPAVPLKPAFSPSSHPIAAPSPLAAAPDAAPSPTASSAQPRSELSCNNPQGTEAVNRCAQRAYASADVRLNEVYRRLKDRLNQKEQQQLVEAETAWINFRDRSCEFERSLTTGETQPRALYQCLQETTENRTAELKAQAQDIH